MIPDEAVEAAAKAHCEGRGGLKIWEDLPPIVRLVRVNEMRPILEAAAPYMLADLVKKAEDPTAEDMDNYFIDQSDVGGWLRSMANPYRSHP